jgi:tRNA (uracil-5-)-methyltransferase
MRDPKCPYFNICGGCSTQHLPYEVQLENKKSRLAKEIGFEDIKVFSDNEWNYRNRMDMVFTPEGLGFREGGKWWKLIRVEECVISNQRLNELNKEICAYCGPDFDPFNVKERKGTFKYAVIRTPQNDSSISFVLNKDSDRLDDAVAKIKSYALKSTANNILITLNGENSSQSTEEKCEIVKGSDFLEEKIMGKTLRYSAQGFFQNNSVMAERMHEYVHGLLKQYSNGRPDRRPNGVLNGPSMGLQLDSQSAGNWNHLLDLYGGVGAFGIVNAGLFHKVTSVESFEGCTIAAKNNIELNGVKNMEAICMDAKRLKQVKLPSKDLYVITDPPRTGMSEETVIELKKLKPKVMVYISCNVEQLGKDLPKFKDYKIRSAAIFDLFPQTNHMESVIELVVR